jgi:UDP-N-acetylmuramyl pentapeptide synthase
MLKNVIVTGSCGKTTTSRFVRVILESARPPGHYYVEELRLFVRLDEIVERARELNPVYGILTCLEPLHLARRSFHEYMREKAEALSYVTDKVFVNADNCGGALGWFASHDAETATFGVTAGDLRATDVVVDLTGTRCKIEGVQFTTPYIGRCFVYSILGAVALCRELGVSLSACAAAIAAVVPESNKGTAIQQSGRTYVNAAFATTECALKECADLLDGLAWPGRKVLVAGELYGVAEWSDPEKDAAAHAAVGGYIGGKPDIDVLVTVGLEPGPQADKLGVAAKAVRPGLTWVHYPNTEAAKAGIASVLQPGDLVLIKGTESGRLWELIV